MSVALRGALASGLAAAAVAATVGLPSVPPQLPAWSAALAVPVAPIEGLNKVRAAYEEVVCPHTPQPYLAVGQWYIDFHQVTDDEVRNLLHDGP